MDYEFAAYRAAYRRYDSVLGVRNEAYERFNGCR